MKANISNRRVLVRSIVADTISPDHFLKFKKKPGGTAVGNLIRLAANKATGGILGTGANRLPVVTSTAKTDSLPVVNSSTPISEAVAKSTDASLKQGIANLTSRAKERLLNGQTDVSNLPKTKMLRNAERLAENMSNEKPASLAMGGMSFNPMMLVGVIVGVILLVVLLKKI